MQRTSVLSPNLSRRISIRKPSVRSSGGIVVSQNRVASEAGARALKAGGHAVDAAVAAAFTVGVAEPWMSGIGGVGGMLVYDAKSGAVTGYDFGGRSPKGLKIEDFRLVPGADADLFGWPAVEGAVNTVGPKAIVTPSQPIGLWTAHGAHGRRPGRTFWPRRRTGDGWPGCRLGYDPDDRDGAGRPCEGSRLDGALPARRAGACGASRQHGQAVAPADAGAGRHAGDAGAEGAPALYRGRLAESIAADVRAMGGYLSTEDLADYRVRTVEPLQIAYGNHRIHVLPELNGGPTLHVAFGALSKIVRTRGSAPEGTDYVAYAHALRAAWEDRFKRLGDAGERSAPTCTTHLTVIDRDGNIAVLTQTLLSLFGSRVTLPGTGILMNNGVNWFDPRPGGPNGIAPDRRVLANYVPSVMTGPTASWPSAAAADARSSRPCSSSSPCAPISASISTGSSRRRASTCRADPRW